MIVYLGDPLYTEISGSTAASLNTLVNAQTGGDAGKYSKFTAFT